MPFCQTCGSTLDPSGVCPRCGPAGHAPPPPPPGHQPQYAAQPQYQQQYQQQPQYQQPPPGYGQQPPPGQYPQQPYYQQPPPGYGYPPPPQKGFLGEIYSRAFGFLFKKPIHLWGVSLLFSLLSILVIIGSAGIPIIALPITLVLSLGMCSVYITGYRGGEVSATQLFKGFDKSFVRNAGGMAWRYLWLIIWGLIPIVGFIFAYIKFYAYRFVPYIMLAEPGITATDALKKSIMQTDGYKGKMFLCDFLISICVGFLVMLITIFSFIVPVLGVILGILVMPVIYAVLPLLLGILEAAYYDKVMTDHPDRK